MALTLSEIGKLRLHNQQLADPEFKTPKDLVSWMGAMQAQDYSMARWAIGTRLPGTHREEIQKAMDDGDIIRTHVLRPTWHLIAAKDSKWMLELTAPHIKASLKSRHKELELTPGIIQKSYKILEKALRGGKSLTRDELASRLEKGKIMIRDQRVSHIFLLAELEGIICSGPLREVKNTYSLLAERVSAPLHLSREEALGTLITKYFESHGPATLQDFTWWSGLPVGDAKKALEMVKHDFHSEKTGLQTHWFREVRSGGGGKQDAVNFLPAYDEFIISYKDRSACLEVNNQASTISSNGIFRPVILVNGKAIGIWKKTTLKNKPVIDAQFFAPNYKPGSKNLRNLLEEGRAKAAAFFA